MERFGQLDPTIGRTKGHLAVAITMCTQILGFFETWTMQVRFDLQKQAGHSLPTPKAKVTEFNYFGY
ncbi:hypothetical protein ASD72_15410 [Pseudoxanthomonas sp. Root630]|nr:hypothetical protein ASD72_15410 [Pseudoxanthomonas sp. Root630]